MKTNWLNDLKAKAAGHVASLHVLALVLAVLAIPVEMGWAGQATGKRQHKPIRATIYYDQATSSIDSKGLGWIALLEAETGSFVVGSIPTGNTITWSSACAGGVPNVTGACIGNLRDGNGSTLALTSPQANRINLVPLDGDSIFQPVSIYLPSLGPSVVVAIDVGGTGNTALDDLFVASQWNGAASAAHRFNTLRNLDGATSFPVLQDRPLSARVEATNPFEPQLDNALGIGLMQRGAFGLTDTFAAFRLDSGNLVEVLAVPGLPAGTTWDWGYFGAGSFAQLIFFQPGGTSVRYAAIGPGPNASTLAVERSGVCLNAASRLDHVLVVGDPIDSRLLTIQGDGATAALYRFAGDGQAALMETFSPQPGERFAGAVGLSTNGFLMLTGSIDTNRLDLGGHELFRPQVNGQNVSYARVSLGRLPELNAFAGAANVRQYQREPFVSANPNLLRTLNAGDWSSRFTQGVGPVVSVNAETFIDAFRGLDDPVSTGLGAPHPLMQFGEVNQYSEFISLGTFKPAVGDEVSDVQIQPPAGRYEHAIHLAMTSSDPTHQIYYRLNGAGNWALYSGTPVTIFANTTVDYYGKPVLGLAKSTVRTARYEFTASPGASDSDNDGVPDFVEIANGLDPMGGDDQDKDGFSDKEELLANRSPVDPTSHPSGSPGIEQGTAFDLVATLRPFDGFANAETTSAIGTLVRLYNLSGGLLGTTIVTNPPLSLQPRTATFREVRIDSRDQVLLVVTEPHFDIVTAGTDKRIGRELTAVFPLPQLPAVQVAYTYGSAGGNAAAESAGWIAAAQTAYDSAKSAPIVEVTVDVASTARTALFERSLLRYLVGRGIDDETNATMFSFRPSDVGRRSLPIDVLVGSEQSVPESLATPVTRRIGRLHAIRTRLEQPAAQPFIELAREIYGLNSRSNNVAPGAYLPPLEFLRLFIQQGPSGERLGHELVHIVQQTRASLPDEAFVAVNYILSGVVPRPVSNVALRVRADSFDGPCATFETTALLPGLVRLVDADGYPYQWPDTFAPIPGAVIEVTGYTDVSIANCPGPALEVIRARLSSLPPEIGGDLDGNLLLDAWEKLFLGRSGVDPFGDADGDGYRNLQELYEGTDPNNRLSMPAAPPANLAPPVVDIAMRSAGPLTLEWSWPVAYANRVRFTILAAADLSAPFLPSSVTPVHLGNGRFRVVLPNASGQPLPAFYQVLARNDSIQ